MRVGGLGKRLRKSSLKGALLLARQLRTKEALGNDGNVGLPARMLSPPSFGYTPAFRSFLANLASAALQSQLRFCVLCEEKLVILGSRVRAGSSKEE